MHPTAHVTAGGSACDAVTVTATFMGTPPFTGRWSDVLPFANPLTQIARAMNQSGLYTVIEFTDNHCADEISGSRPLLHAPTTCSDTFSPRRGRHSGIRKRHGARRCRPPSAIDLT
jgi:hypothetical protein